MTPALVPCSRNAHDQNVLVRRPQWDQRGCHSQKEETSKLGGSMHIVRCAQEGAALATPLKKGVGNWKFLALAKGTTWPLLYEWVRRTRAV